MITLSTLDLRHPGHGGIVQFFDGRSSVDVAFVYPRLDDLESLQLAALLTAAPDLLRALKNLLEQASLFSKKFEGANFETAQAMAAIAKAEGGAA